MAINRLPLPFPLFSLLDGDPKLSSFQHSESNFAITTAPTTVPQSEVSIVLRDVEVRYSSLQASSDIYNGFNGSFTQLDRANSSSSSTDSSTQSGNNESHTSNATTVTYYSEQNNDASDIVPPYMQHMTLILVILHCSVFITGLIGNFLVCLSVYRNKSLQTVTNYYIVNLAVADFLVILICLPPTVYWDLTLTWNFGLVLCKMVLYFQSISVSVSVLTLTCISIDRWYAICRPLKFCSTKYRAKITILLIWIISMLIASPDAIFLTTRPLHEENDYVYMDCTYSWPESSTKMYQLCIVTLLFIGPFVLMSISYSHIVNVLWRNETMADSLQHSIALEEEQQSLKRKEELLSSIANTTIQPPDIQVPTMRILTTTMNNPEAKNELGDTSSYVCAETQPTGTKPCSATLRDLGEEKFAPLVYSSNNQHSLPSSNYSKEQDVREVNAGASRGNTVEAQNKIAQANLPLLNARVQRSCTSNTSSTSDVASCKKVECRFNNIIGEPNQSYGDEALTLRTSQVAGGCAVTDAPDSLKRGSESAVSALGRCDLAAQHTLQRKIEDKISVLAGEKTENVLQVMAEQGDRTGRDNQTFEYRAGLEPLKGDSTSAAFIEISHLTGADGQVLVSSRKDASYCSSSSTGLAEAIFTKEGSCNLIANTLCHRIGDVEGPRDSDLKANSELTLVAENSTNSLHKNESRERGASIRVESKAVNSKGFKVSYNNFSSTSVYVNTTNISRPERQVMNCNGTVSSTLDTGDTLTAQEVKAKSSSETVEKDKSNCCMALLGTFSLRGDKFVGQDKTTKKYRKNLENYAARKDRYREVVLTGKGTRQTLLLSVDTTGCENKREESVNVRTSTREHFHDHLSSNLDPTVKSTNVENSSFVHAANRSTNQVDLHGEVTPRGSTGFNQHYPSSKTRFYKLIESRKKAAKMLIVIVIMFGLCYLPVHFLNILRYTIKLPQNDITTIASLVSHWLCYFNSAVNPLIYNLMSGKFRHEFANLFFCKCLRRGSGS